MGIALLSSKTSLRMDLIRHSPSKQMDISAAKINAVLQRTTGPFTVLVLSSHFLSESQDTKRTVQMTGHHSYSQSIMEPEHPRQARSHSSPSLRSSAPPGIVTARAKASLVVHLPLKLQGTTRHSVPNQNNCIAQKNICRIAAAYTNGSYIHCLRVHITFYFQFPIFFQLTLYYREMGCFEMPLQPRSSQVIPKFKSPTSKSSYIKSKV